MEVVRASSFVVLVALLGCSSARSSETPVKRVQGPPLRLAPVNEPAFQSPGGMWLPAQLGSEHAGALKRLGLELDPAARSDPRQPPLGAVVSLGGCSASFVSAEGLVVTNHHCVTGSLQYNSTPEQNLLEDGFLAKAASDELSIGPTGRVYVTQAFTDVTERMRRGIEQIADPKARHDEMEKREKEIVAECEQPKQDVRCDVASFYGGAQELLIERLEIKDVRLVYAPARGIGNFGGDVDNWRWPRHTADFSFYRAYVGKDGKPAEHAADNVPYRPRAHLSLPSKPLEPGDLVFVAGYPGRTYRLHTAEETEEAVGWYYPYRIRYCEEYLAVLERVTSADPASAIKATPLEKGLNNVLIYTRGALEGLTQGGAAEKRRERDAALTAWIDADPERTERYGGVMKELGALFDAKRVTRDVDAALSEVLRLPSLVGAAFAIVRMAEERAKPDAERDPDYQERNWERLRQSQTALERRYARSLDVAVLGEAGRRAKRLPPGQGRALLEPLTGKAEPTDAEIDAAVTRLYTQTRLEEATTRLELLNKATTARLRARKDPLLEYALALRKLHAAEEDREDAEAGQRSRPAICRATPRSVRSPATGSMSSTRTSPVFARATPT
jgi:hypothetical protein